MKTHFPGGCGRGKSTTEDVYRVTCLVCNTSEPYLTAKAAADAAKRERFYATPPRQFAEPWRDGTITCSECGGDLFRMGDRSCYGHYENYVCAACGHSESRLTETGMSF